MSVCYYCCYVLIRTILENAIFPKPLIKSIDAFVRGFVLTIPYFLHQGATLAVYIALKIGRSLGAHGERACVYSYKCRVSTSG